MLHNHKRIKNCYYQKQEQHIMQHVITIPKMHRQVQFNHFLKDACFNYLTKCVIHPFVLVLLGKYAFVPLVLTFSSLLLSAVAADVCGLQLLSDADSKLSSPRLSVTHSGRAQHINLTLHRRIREQVKNLTTKHTGLSSCRETAHCHWSAYHCHWMTFYHSINLKCNYL